MEYKKEQKESGNASDTQKSTNGQLKSIKGISRNIETMGILQKSMQKNSQTLISLSGGSPARLFPVQAKKEVSLIEQGELFSSKYAESYEIKGQSSFSLKTLGDFLNTTGAKPSQSFSFRFMNSGIVISNGRCVTQRITECLNLGRGYTYLRDILEEKPNPKYSITLMQLQMLSRHIVERQFGITFLIKDSQFAPTFKISSCKEWIIVILEEEYNGKRGIDEQDKIKEQQNGIAGKAIPNPPRPTIQDSLWEMQDRCGLPKNQIGLVFGQLFLALLPFAFQVPENQRKILEGKIQKEYGKGQGSRENPRKGGLESSEGVGTRFKRFGYPTPKEAERLQGFQDDWTKYRKEGDKLLRVPDIQRYKCLGNAVTVNVIEAIMERMFEYERKTKEGE